MLHDKSTKIISEIKNYFSSKEKIFFTLYSEPAPQVEAIYRHLNGKNNLKYLHIYNFLLFLQNHIPIIYFIGKVFLMKAFVR
jgi:hypothetical protein